MTENTESREFFLFFSEWSENINDLPPDDQLRFYHAIEKYGYYRDDTDLTAIANEGLAFKFFVKEIRRKMDFHFSKYANGKKSGRPKKKPNNNLAETEKKPNNNLAETEKKPNNNLAETSVHVHVPVHVREHESFIPLDEKEKKSENNRIAETAFWQQMPESSKRLWKTFLTSRTNVGDSLASDPARQELILMKVARETEVLTSGDWETFDAWIENAVEHNHKTIYAPFPKKVETPHDARKQAAKETKRRNTILAERKKTMLAELNENDSVIKITSEEDAELFLRNTP